MEIYRSPQSKKQAEKPRAIYYSRGKLIAGVVIWIVATGLFGVLTVRALPVSNIWIAVALITLASAWMLFNCVRGLGKLDSPVLLIGRDGIRFPDGVLIAWGDMEENVYLDQSYMGLPVMKMVQIKTTLAKPRVKKLRVSALAMDSDEYMALCDSYSQGGGAPAAR
ncbi:hypothetical protein HRD49_37580 [Corallococcus exiguus]|uniref:Uncharacterized protein n=1 Tax=Corallococcus exiguus TaxID=83462 RepID=A0A7Y1RJY6_9BACT|nr:MULTISPECIES: hypothetical protein [Corallococcus]NBC43967.1 hypothetical protein [Corallococcus exiguus]NNB85875.1 hypothetical protein [Corallococcus exiguus]NNB93929.1 hypothetical protein [Corallococcus exiguus]NNC05266.1 hypothetical protein [Corallococcus exiguus]NNC22050.1 hypothetical protein [Corallococcus exiguus]